MSKKIIIVGAGPGGLAAGMLLSNKGYQVDIYEKQNFIGGRTSSFNLGEYKFDLGPTFLMMKDILNDVFKKSDRNIEDYLTIKEIDPLYRIVYDNQKEFYPYSNPEKMEEELDRVFPGNIEGYRNFMNNEERKFDILFRCLKESFSKPRDLFKKEVIKSIPYLGVRKSLFDVLGKYFKEDDLKMAFTFQAKYLGMSPWKCPGGYSIISYIEHATGVQHVLGGFGEITQSMAKIIEEEGGNIYLNSSVKEIIVEDNEAKGVLLEDGQVKFGDYTILNADFAYAMNNLIKEKNRKKYTKKNIEKKKYSCSTFMLYLGVDKEYDIPHHNIIFSSDYKKNVDEIGIEKVLSDDPSIYIQNAGITDKTLASKGKSTIYVLVPVPNNTSNIDWNKQKNKFREKVLDIIEKKGGLKDIRKHIEVEKMITPIEWEEEMSVYRGAVFNLGHNIEQMLYFRPHNEFEEFEKCYLVGGGTHPGSGLPTIFQSAIITSDLILNKDEKQVNKLKKASTF